MLTRFCVEDGEPAEEVKVQLVGFGSCKAEFYLLDEASDLTPVREDTFTEDSISVCLNFAPQSSYLIKLKK